MCVIIVTLQNISGADIEIESKSISSHDGEPLSLMAGIVEVQDCDPLSWYEVIGDDIIAAGENLYYQDWLLCEQAKAEGVNPQVEIATATGGTEPLAAVPFRL